MLATLATLVILAAILGPSLILILLFANYIYEQLLEPYYYHKILPSPKELVQDSIGWNAELTHTPIHYKQQQATCRAGCCEFKT